MRREITGWTGAVLLAAAASGGAERPATAGGEHLRVAGVALARVPDLARERLANELDAVLEDASVRLDWRWTRPGDQTAPDELLVVFLDSQGRGSHEGRMVLACSGLTGEATAIWVYLPNVAAALGLPGEFSPESLSGVRDLGTALGRVIAHEVVHALAPDLPHGNGLMSVRFHAGQLCVERPRLDARDAARVAAAAQAWTARGGPPPLGPGQLALGVQGSAAIGPPSGP
jgi:hypothetical protein